MKPQDFLLGARDFFAVLIPGTVLLFVLIAFANSVPAPSGLPHWLTAAPAKFSMLPDVVQTFGYGVAGYALGQVVSFLSTLLDWPVDWLERHSGDLLPRYPLLRRLDPDMRLARFRSLAEALRNRATQELLHPGQPYDTAADRTAAALAGESASLWSVKSFWRDYLRLKKPEAVVELEGIESAQKMFRSFGIVALAVAGLVAPTLDPLALTATAAAFLICYFIFAKFRLEFFYRLYKLAVLTTLPDDLVRRVGEPFFASVSEILAGIEPRA